MRREKTGREVLKRLGILATVWLAMLATALPAAAASICPDPEDPMPASGDTFLDVLIKEDIAELGIGVTLGDGLSVDESGTIAIPITGMTSTQVLHEGSQITFESADEQILDLSNFVIDFRESEVFADITTDSGTIFRPVFAFEELGSDGYLATFSIFGAAGFNEVLGADYSEGDVFGIFQIQKDVPEPGTAMLLIGLGGALALRLRRRQAS